MYNQIQSIIKIYPKKLRHSVIKSIKKIYKMESVLYMWCGYLLNWKKYYFVLDEPYIHYCSEKGKEIEGTISLQLINIHVPVDNPVCFNIHTGIDVIYLKALSIQDKVMWVKKLNSIIKNREKSRISTLKQQIGYKSRKQQIIKRFDEFVKQLWISHAKLQGSIENLSQKNLKNYSISNNRNLIDEVRRSAASFKFKATQISKYVEEIGKFIKQESYKQRSQPFMKDSNGSQNDDFDPDETQFLSFMQEDRNNERRDSRQKTNKLSAKKPIFENHNPDLRKKPFSYNTEKQLSISEYQMTPINQIYSSENVIKKMLLSQNEVFMKIYHDISNKRQRQTLPVKFTPESKFPVMSTLTGAMGSNLAKVAFPVTINEPLSMLQKGCEQLYYSQLLKSADMAKDPVQRMNYVAAFIVSMASLNEGRLKKPFNPLLGETFVFDDKEREFFYFSEQVSHHPPISAMYCRSQNFQYIANSTSDLSFTGKSLKLNSSNRCFIQLSSNGDKYWFNKPTMSINNILFGNLYIQISGEVEIKCDMFKTKAIINFNQKSWTKSQCSVEGKIFKNDHEQLFLSGFWNKNLISKDANGKEKILWTKIHFPIHDQYNFNRYTIQLNHLHQGLIKQIPPTDSRFRPDQKILEYRDLDLAGREKSRLEEKQRKRKKQNEMIGKQHNIVWFKQMKSQNENVYQFMNEKYQSERFKDDKWSESLDIFN